jgi:hypothetical protein
MLQFHPYLYSVTSDAQKVAEGGPARRVSDRPAGDVEKRRAAPTTWQRPRKEATMDFERHCTEIVTQTELLVSGLQGADQQARVPGDKDLLDFWLGHVAFA